MNEQAKPHERATFRIGSTIQHARERVAQFGQSFVDAFPKGNQLIPVGPDGQTFSQVTFMAAEGNKKKKKEKPESVFDRINREVKERAVTGSDARRPLGKITPEMKEADKKGGEEEGSGSEKTDKDK